MKKKVNKSGFTLVEVLFAVIISVLLTAGVVKSFVYHARANNAALRHIETGRISSAGNFQLVYGTPSQASLREASANSIERFRTGDDWVLKYKVGTSYDSGVTVLYTNTQYSYTYSNAGGFITDHAGNVVVDGLVHADVDYSGNNVIFSLTSTMTDSGGITTTNLMKTSVIFRN